MAKELIKIGIIITVGIVLALLLPIEAFGGWVFLIYPVYLLGFVYGFLTFIPWIGKTVASISSFTMLSIIMKSLLGFIILIILLPIALAVLLTIGWFVGIVKLVMALVEAIREEGGLGLQRRRLHRDWKSRERGGGGRKQPEYPFFPEESEYDDEQELLEESWDDDGY